MDLFRPLYNHLIRPFIDTLYPPYCVLCDNILPVHREIVCTCCIEKITLAREHISLPLPAPSFDDVIVLCEYDEQIKSLIHLLKYNRFTKVTFYLAEWAHKEKCLKRNYDYVIPVPLHHIKLRERGYNQSAELARHLSLAMQTSFSDRILKRTRYTVSQTTFTREGRSENVRDAFKCTVPLHGISLLLVDDVVTTGSTANECARVLKNAGANRVDIFALANPSLRESSMII